MKCISRAYKLINKTLKLVIQTIDVTSNFSNKKISTCQSLLGHEVITDFTLLVFIIISSLLHTTAFSNTDGTTIDKWNTTNMTMKTTENELNYNQSTTRKSHSTPNYFLQFKRTVSIKLKNAQPDATDETIEFQSWILSVIAMIIMTFVFICCFIPLIFCLACKICSYCTCTGCKSCFQPV
uniref:Uncharacterized protein n=1 Tax=Onchocerca volvulus TaxID=6282 RepID=A0A8R1Y3F6_ONCVO